MSHTPGPWRINKLGPARFIYDSTDEGLAIADVKTFHGRHAEGEAEANASLIAAAPDLLAALRLHKAWADSEDAGPDYGGQTRDTHPDGHRIWRQWWQANLDLCARANEATNAAIAKAEGRS